MNKVSGQCYIHGSMVPKSGLFGKTLSYVALIWESLIGKTYACCQLRLVWFHMYYDLERYRSGRNELDSKALGIYGNFSPANPHEYWLF